MSRAWLWAEVPTMERIPHRWLGRAWYRFDTDVAVYVAMPFNVLFRWALGAWWYLRCPDPSEWESRFHKRYQEAYRLGVDSGHRMATGECMDRLQSEYHRGRQDVVRELRTLAGMGE